MSDTTTRAGKQSSETAGDNAYFQAIMDASNDAIIVADGQGRILRASAATARIFGHTPSSLIGASINLLMPSDIKTLHNALMQRFIDTGTANIMGRGRDVSGQHADGSVIPLHITLTNSTSNGHQTFIAIMQDLRLRRSAESALARSQRLDAIGQMTGGIAHDFNNLLTVVTGNLELLDMRVTDDRLSALIADALDAAEIGANLTSRLTAFARKGILAPTKTDLREVCSSVLGLLERTLGAAYTISTDFPDSPAFALVDPAQLQSALVNLALNARDAMPNGGDLQFAIGNVLIDDSYLAQETDICEGDYIRITVTDTGTGMTADAQARAFEPFFTTKPEGKGTGLGLAMVYGFVRQSGGHITIYSELGHGTSFGVYFPAWHGSEAVETREVASQPDAVSRLANGQVVLIVDDDPKIRRLTAQRLHDLGFRTIQTETGDAAYALLKRGAHIDIVFSDLVMPGKISGYDLAAIVAQDFPDIKILLTSGYVSDAVTRRMTRATDHDILHKPYRYTDLAARLAKLLS